MFSRVLLLGVIFLLTFGNAKEFGAYDNGDGTVTVFHKDKGWTALWSEMCIQENCKKPQKSNGSFSIVIPGKLGDRLNIEFTVQDFAIGKYVLKQDIQVTTPNEILGSSNLLYISRDSDLPECFSKNKGIIVLKGIVQKGKPSEKPFVCTENNSRYSWKEYLMPRKVSMKD